jgi:hypothetical protein
MEIKARKAWGEYYEVVVKTSNTTVVEDMFTWEQVNQMAVDFVEDTILQNSYQDEIIQRLIAVGLIDVEQLREYMADLEE